VCRHAELTLAPRGIGVSGLCPGFIRTKIMNSRRNVPQRFTDPIEQPPTEGPGAEFLKMAKRTIPKAEIFGAMGLGVVAIAIVIFHRPLAATALVGLLCLTWPAAAVAAFAWKQTYLRSRYSAAMLKMNG
jgi:NAD(P)-dependent dehydrogenase (short-subunit alcohol dehydrogenase family)